MMDLSDAKHVGIVACSAEGAALCYRTFCREGENYLGEHNHPQVSMHTLPLALYMRHINAGDWSAVADLMLTSVRHLASIGAEVAICPDNTIHEAFTLMQGRSPIPWLHIAEVVAEAAQQHGRKKLLITGTKYLLRGPVYPAILEPLEIAYAIPNLQEQEEINRMIFTELVKGKVSPAAQQRFDEIIGTWAGQGCDAVVLACTELPLLVEGRDSPLATLDSTRLLARAALRYAVAI
jgi:aspartate racemase